MDNLSFEKIWIDDNPYDSIFQVKISASNDRICMSSNVYMQPLNLLELADGIFNLLDTPFEIEFGNNDDSCLDWVVLNFIADKRGRVRIKTYMKSNAGQDLDGTAANDTATFHIDTELASLDEFSRCLSTISVGEIGAMIALTD